MSSIRINKTNVGRIAERIVSNELEYRGFRVSDLNKEGPSANADLLAAKDGNTWQIQVKGATEGNDGWWFNYGRCNEAIIEHKETRMFNRSSSFYEAKIVVLVSVKSPIEYCCAVLPVESAEKAVQINLDREYRTRRKDNRPKRPGPVWSSLNWIPERTTDERKDSFKAEQEILQSHRDKWDLFDASISS